MYNAWIDFLRIAAAFFIVGRHVGLPSPSDGVVAVSDFCDAGVAIFAVISGFFTVRSLMGAESLSAYSRKRIGRILPLYIGWSVFYLCVRMIFQFVFKGGVSSDFFTLDFAFGVLFCGSAACHLWFLIDLLYCQLLIAVLWYELPKVRTFLSRFPLLHLCVAFLLIFLSCQIPGYVGYYLMRLSAFLIAGMGIAGFRWRNYEPRWIALILLFIYLLLFGLVPRFYCDLLLALAVVTFVVGNADSKVISGSRCVRSFAKGAFGVYLIHPFFVIGVREIIIRAFPTSGGDSAYGFPHYIGIWIVTYLFSLVVTAIFVKLGKAGWVGFGKTEKRT